MSRKNEIDTNSMAVFTGNANPALAHEITRHLHLPMGRAHVDRFSDGEVNVEIMENVRGRDVFIVQPTCPPANDNLMELLMMTDACRRASAKRVTAVVPYFGYGRQDRRPRATRVAIAAKLVANMIASAGVDRLLTVDLHADQIQGFFDIPVDNVYASPVLLGDAWRHKQDDMIVVSPDVGGVVRARAMAKRLDDADLAIIDKRRPRPNESKVMNIIGEVEGKSCVLIDDMVDTAGTLCQAAQALKDEGASRVVAYITHAVLSGAAIERIGKSVLDEIVVTDTIPLSEAGRGCARIRQLSVAGLLAETIRRISDEESVSSLYVD
jgi:ribose-phosphate pyrophosphokinase